MRLRSLSVLVFFLLSVEPVRSDQSLNADELGQSIVSALRLIWPNEVFSVEIVGCRFQLEQISRGEIEQESLIQVWLGDLETSPDRVYRSDGQLIGDGEGKTWRDYQVVYMWRPEVLEANKADVARWMQKSNLLFGDEQTTDQQFEDFVLEMSDGAFGPFFQRNFGWSKIQSDQHGAFTEPMEMVSSDPYIASGLSPLGFIYRDTVIDVLLANLHVYAQDNCPDEQMPD